MSKVSTVIGILLCLLGIGTYFGTGMQSVTALIPAFFGLALLGLGLAARDAARRKLSMHVAVAVALLGLLGSARGLPGALSLARGGEVERPAAVLAQTAMAVLCVVFLVLAVKSFIDARRRG